MSTKNIFYPLITPEQLKMLISTINNSISNDYIKSLIEIEQKKAIRPLLGYSLYNQIQEQYSGYTYLSTTTTTTTLSGETTTTTTLSGETTTTTTTTILSFSPENEILYDDYLKMILAYSVYKRLVIDMTYQLENNGLRKKFSDVSEVAEKTELTYVRNEIQNDLDFYKTELIKYINNNRGDYPLYFNDTDSRYNSLNDSRVKGYDFNMNISSSNYPDNGFIIRKV